MAEQKSIVGYAAVFDSLSLDLGGFVEKIAPGAFTETLKRSDDVVALFDHEIAKLLGRSTSGTLRLSEDSKGLKVTIAPPDTATGREVVELLGRGDLSKMSFSFRTVGDSWETRGELPVRTLERVNLVDISVVVFPAYPSTSVGLRSGLQLAQQPSRSMQNNYHIARLNLELAKRRCG